MSCFSDLQSTPPPRPRRSVARFVPQLVPSLGFYAYGVLYFVFLAPWAPLLTLLATTWLLSAIFSYGPSKPITAGAGLFVTGVTLVAGAATLWPFARWVRRKKAPTLDLLESGLFVEAWIDASRELDQGETTLTTEALSFQHDGDSVSASLSYPGPPGGSEWRPLLVLRGRDLVVGFGPSGNAIGGRVVGGWPMANGSGGPPPSPERVLHANVPFVLRAVLALGFLFGLYLLALGLAGLLVAIPYFALVELHRISIKLTLASLAGAFAIVRALFFARPPPFVAPGPTLRAADQPELFAVIESIATELHTRMPAHVYLIPDVNAFVSEVGGFLGFGTTRIMGIGLGLLAVDDVSSLKATIAHEFGHFTGGDTALGGVVYRTRASIGRLLDSLGHGVLAKPFEWYGRVYLRITYAVSRHQELEADRTGIRIAGRDAHIDGLQQETRAGVAFAAFVTHELAPLCAGGMCPRPIYHGFTQFLARLPSAELDALLARRPSDPFDTHPALPARLAFARSVADPGVVRDTRSALSLLKDEAAVEIAIEPYLFGALGVTGMLTRIAWDDVAASFYTPRLAEEARECAARLFPILGTGVTYRDVARGLMDALESPQRLSELAGVIEPKLGELPPLTRQDVALHVLARALGVLAGAALVERGGVWRTAVGAPLTVDVGGESFEPLVAGNEALKGTPRFDALRAMVP